MQRVAAFEIDMDFITPTPDRSGRKSLAPLHIWFMAALANKSTHSLPSFPTGALIHFMYTMLCRD